MLAQVSSVTTDQGATIATAPMREDQVKNRRETEKFEVTDMVRGGELSMFLRSRPRATVVSVVGSVNNVTSPYLGKRLRGLVESGERRVLIDMGCVEQIDSSAIATLLDCLHHLWRRGGQMAIFGVRPRVRAWFEIFMLDGVLRL
jgi:anti-sigma B factor antagonist